MTWISYAERKPEPEPKRQLWAKYSDGLYGWIWSNDVWRKITHWAEIEGLGEEDNPFGDKQLLKVKEQVDAAVDGLDVFINMIVEPAYKQRYGDFDFVVGDYGIKRLKPGSPPPDPHDDVERLAFKIVRQLADEIRNRDRLKDLVPVSPPTKSDPPPPSSFQQGMADNKAGRVVDMETALSTPPPDPFEEWYKKAEKRLVRETYFDIPLRHAWDAAMKHKGQ